VSAVEPLDDIADAASIASETSASSWTPTEWPA